MILRSAILIEEIERGLNDATASAAKFADDHQGKAAAVLRLS